MVDQNQVSFRGAVNLMRQILIVVLSIELIGFLVLGTYYLQHSLQRVRLIFKVYLPRLARRPTGALI